MNGGVVMKLSTKGRYGLKAMFYLAVHHGEGPIPLKHVAERQGISEHYLEQLAAGLRRAKLIKSVRGAQGGYMLSKHPKDITVGDVLRALEGPLAPADCVIEGEHVECDYASFCVTRSVWEKIKNGFNEVVDSITLQDMCDEADTNKTSNLMYYI
jgi:Rrf2 family cysteine metabolism transcriptional repressor